MGFLDNYKINSIEASAAKVQSAPDTLTGTTQSNKKVFDSLGELIISRFNAVLDKLGTVEAKDVVVERGSNTNWEWEKWNSGYCKARKKVTKKSSVTFMTSGSVYRSSNETVNLPFTFVTVRAPVVTVSNASAATWATLYTPPTSKSVSFVFVKGGVASADITYWLEVEGTWK